MLNKNKITITSYNNQAEKWNNTRQEFWIEISQEVERVLKDNNVFKKNKTTHIMDAGCGNGRFYKFFKNNYSNQDSFYDYKYIGFDPSENLINIAKKQYDKDLFYINNLLSFDYFIFTNNQMVQIFDVIFSFAVFHHFSRDEFVIALNNLKNMKHKDSIIIMTLWHRENITNKEEFKTLFENDSQRYIYNYDLEELRDIFLENNCEILDLKIIQRNQKSKVGNIFCVIR